MRVALVLGAGGIAGGSFHAGALAALAEATGWDARDADVVVGTSAGSLTGTLLRAGVAPADLLAASTDAPLSAEAQRLLGRARTPERFTRAGRGAPRPSNPLLLGQLATGRVRPMAALTGLLPAGQVDASWIGQRVEEVAGGPAWPDRPLWIVAVRLRDGRPVVFGRDRTDAPLGAAVAASCAIPAFFAPVSIDGERHVDGGVHSTTNVDLVAGLGHDLVVVSAPMAGRWRSLRPHVASVTRTAARLRLDREVQLVRRRSTPVLVLQPGPDDTPLMDGASMDPRRRGVIAEQAHASVLAHLREPRVAERVALLGRRPAAR